LRFVVSPVAWADCAASRTEDEYGNDDQPPCKSEKHLSYQMFEEQTNQDMKVSLAGELRKKQVCTDILWRRRPSSPQNLNYLERFCHSAGWIILILNLLNS
jgi:hypothetical protein